MKLSKSILLLASLFLIVGCGRRRNPNNENNNENNNPIGNDYDDLLKNLQKGYVANVTLVENDQQDNVQNWKAFFGDGICGDEGINYFKGNDDFCYSSTIDFQNNLNILPAGYVEEFQAYDELFVNGYSLFDKLEFINGSFDIGNDYARKIILSNLLVLPIPLFFSFDVYFGSVILTCDKDKNLELEFDYKLFNGVDTIHYTGNAEYISFDYSNYILKKLPTLPEQDKIEAKFQELRSLDSYKISLEGDGIQYYVRKDSLLIENVAFNSQDLTSFLYFQDGDILNFYKIINGEIVDNLSTKNEDIKNYLPTFDFAKEIFLCQSTDFYIFSPKVTCNKGFTDMNELIPFPPKSFGLSTDYSGISFNVGEENTFEIYSVGELSFVYYDYNCTTIPTYYMDLVESYTSNLD